MLSIGGSFGRGQNKCLSQVRKCSLSPLIQRCSMFGTATSNKEKNLHYDRDTGTITELKDNIYKPLYHTVIGIEIHAQLAVPTKLFSSSPTKHHEKLSYLTDIPNTTITAHDIGYPGTLPLLSRKSVQYAVLSAAALNCQIQTKSRFERKHYFYPDLPLGYQVTQQRWPLAKEGILTCRRYVPTQIKGRKQNQKLKEDDRKGQDKNKAVRSLSKFFNVGIDRIQIEQDTGKTITVTQDFNRAGCTLIEIVFKPQIKSAHEAASVASTVQSLLKHIQTCDGKMEDGSLRIDLNVSIAPINDQEAHNMPLDHDLNEQSANPFQKYLPKGAGNRIEVKNLNSLRQIIQSVEYEGLRQAQSRLNGDTINQETRTFDPKTGVTLKLRDKGDAVDYRFMPEPDLPPLILNRDVFDGKTLVDFIDDKLPELPEDTILRLIDGYGISESAALVIAADRPAISFFEEAVKQCVDNLVVQDESVIKMIPVNVSNWLCNDLFALLKESALSKGSSQSDSDGKEESDDILNHPISIEYSKVNAHRFGLLIAMVTNEVVSTKQAKRLLEVMYKEDQVSEPKSIADERGWKLITDPIELKELCRKTILNPQNQKQLDQYNKGGKHAQKMKKFFIGKIMAASEGNAHPELLQNALDKTLLEISPDVK